MEVCPSPETLTHFVHRALPEPDSDRVRDHLDVCDPCRIGIVAGLSQRATEPTTALDAELATGLVLGPFELVRRIGEGGMGIVYEATDHRLGRSVALKLVRGGHDATLLDEARALARIRHPAVLTVYEAGELDGAVYLATELIRGMTLRAYCADLPRDELVACYIAAADGLAAAHAHGLVHRDFKPDNVLVEPGVRGEPPRVLVADFGLAIANTAPGAAPAGTLPYMAPEQIDGASVDARTDVYAFCASLYEALAGTRPFAGTTLHELRRDMQQQPARPRSVPEIVMRGLALRADDRPTLAELVAALQPLRSERERQRRRRRAAAMAGSVVVMGALVTGAAIARLRTPSLAERCTATPTPARVMAGWQLGAMPAWVRERTGAMIEAREAEVASLQRAVCRDGDADAQRAWIRCRRDHAIEEAELAISLRAPWRSYAGLTDALALPWPATCTSPAARLDAVATPAAEQARAELARARLAAASGQRWHLSASPLEAERLLDEATYLEPQTTRGRIARLERAVELAERAGHLTTAARGWLALAQALGEGGTHGTRADTALVQAEWAIDRAGNPPALRAHWHMVSVSRAWQRSDLATAQRHAEAAAALAGDDPHRRATATHALAAAAAARADFRAQRLLLESLLPTVTGMRDANAARFFASYAECLYHLDELPAARRAADRAVELARETAGTTDRVTANALLVRGSIQLDEGDVAGCDASITEALRILRGADPRDEMIGSALNLRSSARAERGDFRAALADSEAAIAIFEPVYGSRAEQVIFARTQAGEQAKMLDELGSARQHLERALGDARVAYGPEDPRTADVERSLGAVYGLLGQRRKARVLLEHALAVHTKAEMPPAHVAQTRGELARLGDPK